MKNVSIVFRTDDESIACEIRDRMTETTLYEVELCKLNEDLDVEECYHRWWGTIMPQLVITINLAGFSWRNTGGNTMYSMLGMNTIHYIDRDIENEEKLLFGLLPVTMKFVTNQKHIEKRLRKNYRRIHDVVRSDRIAEELPSMLESMDWRK